MEKKLLYVLKTLFSEKKNLLGKKCYNMWLKHFLCVADLVFSTILNKLLLNSKFSISRSDAWMKSWMPWPTTTTTSTWTKPPWSTRSMCTSGCWTRSSTASSSTCRSRWRSWRPSRWPPRLWSRMSPSVARCRTRRRRRYIIIIQLA